MLNRQIVIVAVFSMFSSAQAGTVIHVDDDNCPALSDCCLPHDTPGCDDQECEAIVCAVVPRCCNVDWYAYCAAQANELCGICTLSGGNGTEQDPYCSIQDAIDNAQDGDEVVVAPGTYDGQNWTGTFCRVRPQTPLRA